MFRHQKKTLSCLILRQKSCVVGQTLHVSSQRFLLALLCVLAGLRAVNTCQQVKLSSFSYSYYYYNYNYNNYYCNYYCNYFYFYYYYYNNYYYYYNYKLQLQP